MVRRLGGIVTDEAKPFFTAEEFQDPVQEAVYLDLSHEAAKQIADYANARVEPLREERDALRAALTKCLPIVEEAFWDQHTAGTLPGSGYNHKAQNLAGRVWGWRNSDKFTAWIEQIRAVLAKYAREKGES